MDLLDNVAADLKKLATAVGTLLSSSALDPATKNNLATDLATVGQPVAAAATNVEGAAGEALNNAPAEAEAVAETGIKAAATLGGPVAEAVAAPAAEIIGPVVDGLVSKWLAIFDAHNKNLVSALTNAAEETKSASTS
jgi:hypothetical protein